MEKLKSWKNKKIKLNVVLRIEFPINDILGEKITSNKSLVTFSRVLSANFEFPEGSLKVSVEEQEAKDGSFFGTTQRTF